MDNIDLPMPPEIRAFLEGLLDEVKIAAKGDLRENMISDLYERLQSRFMQVLAEHLAEADLKTYTNLAAENQQKAVEFLQAREPKFPEYLLQAMQEFKQTFLA